MQSCLPVSVPTVYTNTFAALAEDHPTSEDEEFARWHQGWTERLSRQSQSVAESVQLRRASNPVFIPRNHLVEAALAAAQQGDLSRMERLLDVLTSPYNYTRPAPEFRLPAPAGDTGYKTYCGT